MNEIRLKNRILAVLLMLTLIFTVSFSNSYAASSNKIKLKSYTAPTNIKMGKAFTLKGKIKAGKKISKVIIAIVDSNGSYVYKYKKKVNKKSFNIKKADKSLKFGTLKEGKYYYRIKVKLKGKKYKQILNQAFYVYDNNADTIGLGVADSVGITLDGVTAPGTYDVGRDFAAKGVVNSESKIKKVEVGIVFKPTNKWTEYKYTASTNANSFDLSRAASALKFNQLPGGTYYYRMYAHTEAGVKICFNKEFTVRPSGKPQAAVNWAIKIAADDTFNYGAKPYANANGCYFCGTNDKKVKNSGGDKRYLKTYVCLTFVGAAYAHGAGDPEILYNCQRRKMTMYETNDNFKKFSCWMKLGSCSELKVSDLQPGDVIIKWSDKNDNNGHVCMYIGNNNLVEASGGTWKPKSIAVKNGAAASRLASLSGSSKNYVMRYRH